MAAGVIAHSGLLINEFTSPHTYKKESEPSIVFRTTSGPMAHAYSVALNKRIPRFYASARSQVSRHARVCVRLNPTLACPQQHFSDLKPCTISVKIRSTGTNALNWGNLQSNSSSSLENCSSVRTFSHGCRARCDTDPEVPLFWGFESSPRINGTSKGSNFTIGNSRPATKAVLLAYALRMVKNGFSSNAFVCEGRSKLSYRKYRTVLMASY